MKKKKSKYLYVSMFFFISLLCYEARCVDDFNESNLWKECQLTKNFIELNDCSKLRIIADEMIKVFYTRKNIENHIAYHAIREGGVDSFKGRDSYNFVIHHSSEESDSRLPGLMFKDLDPLLQSISKLIEVKLGIKKGRYLIGIQRYYQESVPLPLHYDQQFLDLEVKDKNVAPSNEAIVPNKTAILTLINNTIGGGTRVSNKDKSNSIVIEYASSDLLVFNNAHVLHGVDAFKENFNFDPPYVRYTLSWHSIEYDCQYYNSKHENSMIDITYEEAVERNYKFEKNKWQRILYEWESQMGVALK